MRVLDPTRTDTLGDGVARARIRSGVDRLLTTTSLRSFRIPDGGEAGNSD